jgi:hypothetical protein
MMAIATNPTMPLLPQRCEEPEQVADDVAAQERHVFSSARIGFSIE